MPQLASERRCGVVVRPVRQRQVMLRIEKIDFFHLSAKVTIIFQPSVKELDIML